MVNFCQGLLYARHVNVSYHFVMMSECRLQVSLARKAKISSGQLAFFAGGMKLDLELTRSPEELKALFQSLQDPRDIAALLEVEHRDLVFWIYRTKEKDRYTSFKIAKRNGTPRVIDAPTTNVKILQQKLNTVLQAVYRTKPRAC